MRKIKPKFEAYASKKEPSIRRKLEKQFDSIQSSGTEHVKNIPEDASILYTPLHKSHLDYIILLADTFRQNLPFPRVVSGTNLLSGFTGAFIQYIAQLDFNALGTIGIPRTLPPAPKEGDFQSEADYEKAKKHFETLKQAREVEVKHFQDEFSSGLENEVLAIFPEAREVESGIIKTGRTYTGKERAYSPLFAREAVTKNNLFVIPTAITYDWIPETLLFERLINAKNQGKEWSYRRLEARAFYHDLWKSGKGNVHIKYGEPIKASGMRAQQLVKKAQADSYNLVHPTDIMIACYVARQRFNSENWLNGGTIPVVGANHESILAKEGLREQRNFFDAKDAYKTAQEFLIKQKVLSRTKGGDILITNPHVLNHYANQVEHFFNRN